MLKLLPPGKLRRALILTSALALTAQVMSQVVLTFIQILKELLPMLRP